jgi:acetoacetyl-CoA reductase/3-oxoacyl-[acyl-carrier protein] reductase
MFGLDGKVILVTGGNRGIGGATVELLETLGAKVASVCRSGNGNGNGNGHHGKMHVKADVTDPEAMRSAADQIEAELGPIYGVVANAGITNDMLFSKMQEASWNEVIDVNLNGVFHTIQPIVPRMYERKEGALVFVSSIVGERGNVGQANYAASKAALIGLAKALAREGARYNVRANVVAPGFIETDMLKPIPENVREKILQEIPARRFGKPEEIAWAIAYLLSPLAAGYTTGNVLRVNGGHHT